MEAVNLDTASSKQTLCKFGLWNCFDLSLLWLAKLFCVGCATHYSALTSCNMATPVTKPEMVMGNLEAKL